MDQLDEKMEQRVWQRVRGETQIQPTLQSMAAAEQSNAAVYLMLSRMAQGHEKGILRQLFERERSHGRCLNGINLLQNGQALSVRTAPPESDRMDVALRKCYIQTLRAIKAYQQRQADEEYGHVYRDLARQEEEHCAMILEILGTWKR